MSSALPLDVVHALGAPNTPEDRQESYPGPFDLANSGAFVDDAHFQQNQIVTLED